MLDGLLRLEQHSAQCKRDGIQMRLQQREVLWQETGEKLIAQRCLLRNSHGSLPLRGKSTFVSLSRPRPSSRQTIITMWETASLFVRVMAREVRRLLEQGLCIFI